MSATAVLCADGVPAGFEPGDHTGGVRLVPSLCARPGQLGALLSGSPAAVIGTCPGEHDSRAIRSAVRRAGLDALGVELLDLSQAGDATRLRILLAGARARAAAFAGSRPEQVKPVLRPVINRRALLRLPLPDYVAVPGIDPAACAASSGCRVCVDACPHDAFSWASGTVTLDADRCEPCGTCVAMCPTGAIATPTCTPHQLDQQVRALLAGQDAGESRGIVLTCSRATAAETDPQWFPVVLPCTAMASLQWLVEPLLLGAGSVAVRRCSDVGCPLGNDAIVEDRVDLARRLLGAIGDSTNRVGATTRRPPMRRRAARAMPDAFTSAGAVAVLLALVEGGPDPGATVHVEHPASPFGLVSIDPQVCTVCGSCAEGCPTDALSVMRDGDTVSLTFAAAACTACGLCVRRCPEIDAGAITCAAVVDTDALRAGGEELATAATQQCRRCGDPVASTRTLDRIAGLLGAEHHAALEAATRYCRRCRGAPRPLTMA